MNNIAQTWTNRWYGFWYNEDDDPDTEFPPIELAIDLDWNPDHKNKLISYLRNSHIVLSAGSRKPCCLCEHLVAASCYCTDGNILFKQGLIHEVEYHHVRLPDNFVAHIRNMNYIPPKELDLRISNLFDLPWPKHFAEFLKKYF